MRHVYLHVPFCARRCSYCDFAIAVRRRVPAEAYVQAVLTERALRAGNGEPLEEPLHTLYLGGGTPSALPPNAVIRLVGAFPLVSGGEVTLEANPDDVTASSASAWRDAGITRVSLGAQSFQDHVLSWMHRTHTAAAAERAVDILRAAGFHDISLDLIFGLPEELDHDWRTDLACAVRLQPEHLSVYGLTVEPRTPLARWIGRGACTPPDDERYRREFLEAHHTLEDAGYRHYEISNFAREGAAHAARHNRAYWEGAPYAGLGPSAHGFSGTVRRWNRREWVAYRDAVTAGRDPLEGQEALSDAQRRLERLYLGLRTASGVAAELVDRRDPEVLAAIGRGWLSAEYGTIRPTVEGWLMLDELLPRLTTSGEGG